ncbi:hypothetical protein AOR04_06330 [Pseudoalteromonas sp. 1_2015MBL_MicDiv]|nr:hypothetical protein AOR04_06330 [Pseudoalteromonas sp. 1_2015MBL_MicDiv]
MTPTKKLYQGINNQIKGAVNEHGEQLKFNINGDKFHVRLRIGEQILFTQSLYYKGINNCSLGGLTSVAFTKGSLGV